MQIFSSTRRIDLPLYCPVISRTKHFFSLTWLLFFAISLLFGQDGNKKAGLTITCELPATILKNNKDLEARIIIRNNSNGRVVVYDEINEGNFDNITGDNKVNLTLIVQHKKAGKFREYSNSTFIDASPAIDTADTLKKINLASKASTIKYFHLDSRYRFDSGSYRIRCLYWNNVHVNKNIVSNWVYFRVAKTIYVKHYWNETFQTDSTKSIRKR